MKMCGATNGFIRWPFVYEGFMLGLLGAVIAFFLQWALYAAVARGVDSNDTLQLIQVMPFSELWAPVAAVFALAGIVIGESWQAIPLHLPRRVRSGAGLGYHRRQSGSGGGRHLGGRE